MASAATTLVTFAELEQMPELPGDRWELHEGELVRVPPPLHGHRLIQRIIQRTLERGLGRRFQVEIELGFRTLGEHEYRVADVAVMSSDRWRLVPRNGYIEGAPEIVIEAILPSNRLAVIRRTGELCLANGCIQFWTVDPKRGTIQVRDRDGLEAEYGPGDQLPLPFGCGLLGVSSVFE